MSDRPRWRALREGELPRPGTLPYEINGKRWVLDDDDDCDDDADGDDADAVAADTAGDVDAAEIMTPSGDAAASCAAAEAGGAAHAPGNGLDPAAAKASALREVAARLVKLPKLERELQQQSERERLGASAAAMKAAIEEAQAKTGAEAEQAEAQQAEDPDYSAADEPDDAVIARLAKLPVLEYERQREEAAAQLDITRLTILDRLVADQRRKDHPAGSAARGVKVAEPIPAAAPVDTGVMLTTITKTIRRHVILLPALARICALWIAHTWVYERFDHTPRLCAISPVRRCGKSTLMALLRMLTHRPLKADNISASGTFRVIETLRPLTLLLDETDTFLKENEELRGVLDSGFERDGQVIRVVEINGEHVPVGFSTYCPVALAAIRQMPDTIADRAIRVDLQRKRPNETIEKLRLKRNKAALATLASQLARWAADNCDQLGDDPDTPEVLDDRQGDISVPLLAIADFAGDGWPEQARKDLVAIFGTDTGPDGDIGIQLLSDIRTVLGDDRTADRNIASAELCRLLAEVEESPWSAYGKARKPISQTQLAGLLRPYKITSGTVRLDINKTARGYKREQFREAWDRYTPRSQTSSSATPPNAASVGVAKVTRRHNPQKSAVFWPNPGDTNSPDVSSGNQENPSNINDVSAVSPHEPPQGGYTGADDDSEAIL